MYYWESISESDLGLFLDSSARLKISELLHSKYHVNPEIATPQKLYEYLRKKSHPDISANISKDKLDLLITSLIMEDINLTDEEKSTKIRNGDFDEYKNKPKGLSNNTFHPLDPFLVGFLEELFSYSDSSDQTPLSTRLTSNRWMLNYAENELSYDEIKETLSTFKSVISIPEITIKNYEDLFLFFIHCYRAFLPEIGLMRKHDPLYSDMYFEEYLLLYCAAYDNALFYTKQSWSDIFNSEWFKKSVIRAQIEQMIIDVYIYLCLEVASKKRREQDEVQTTDAMFVDSALNLLVANKNIEDFIQIKSKYNSAYKLLIDIVNKHKPDDVDKNYVRSKKQMENNTRYLFDRLHKLRNQNESFRDLVKKPITKFQYPFFALTILLSKSLPDKIATVEPSEEFTLKLHDKVNLIIEIGRLISDDEDLFNLYGFQGLNAKAQLFLTTYILEMHYGLILSEMLYNACEDYEENFDCVNVNISDIIYKLVGLRKPMCRLHYIKRFLELPFEDCKEPKTKKDAAKKNAKYVDFIKNVEVNFNDQWLHPLSKNAILLTIALKNESKDKYQQLFCEMENYISNMDLLIPSIPAQDSLLGTISAQVYKESFNTMVPKNKDDLNFDALLAEIHQAKEKFRQE